MNTKTLSSSILGFALIAAALILFSVVASRVQAASIFDITYPIAELGGCEDRLACKAYCEDENNMDACEEFASNYGISSAPKVDKSEKMKKVKEDGGPGQCADGAEDPQASCKAYCDSIEHIDECVAYGKSHGLLTGEQLVEAEKVSSALKRGAKLPEGCTNQSSCKETCENPSTIEQARSCFAFGKEAGLLPDDFNEERAEKVFKAIQDGTAPFKSPRDFQKCENPESDEIMQKCMDFAVSSGMMDEKQAEIVKKTGGKGPGGCRGERQCNAYCEENPEECFQFSKDNGLIGPEQEEQMKRGAEQFKQGIDNAPEAVRTCVTSIIGQDKLDAVTSGTAMMDRSLGEKMRTCFEQSRPPEGERGQFMGPPPGEEGRRFMGPPPQDEQGENRMQGPREGQPYPPQQGERERFMGPPQGGEEGRYMGPPSGYEGYRPPEGMMQPPPQGGEEGRYMGPPSGYEGYRPPEGTTQPPPGMMPTQGGEYRPPENPAEGAIPQPPLESGAGAQPPPSESYVPPPPAESSPPPAESPPPPPPATTASEPTASVWSAFRSLLGL